MASFDSICTRLSRKCCRYSSFHEVCGIVKDGCPKISEYSIHQYQMPIPRLDSLEYRRGSYHLTVEGISTQKLLWHTAQSCPRIPIMCLGRICANLLTSIRSRKPRHLQLLSPCPDYVHNHVFQRRDIRSRTFRSVYLPHPIFRERRNHAVNLPREGNAIL